MSAPLSQTFGKEKSPYQVKDFRIEVTRVTGLWPRRVFLQWILRKPTSNTGYFFSIYRSHSPEGPWEELILDLEDTYYYIDNNFLSPSNSTSAGQYSLKMSPYYKVVVTHAQDGTVEHTKKLEASSDRRRAGIINKLRRDARVALRKGNGTEVAVLKRKWYGENCTCRSATGQSTRSHCDNCYGTGVVFGYWNPVYGFASRSATPVSVNTDVQGKTENHVIRVLVEYIPEIIPDDILVFIRDNKRYLVIENNPTEIQTVTVHQELVMSELSRSSVEYGIPADNWHTPPWF